MFFPSDPVVGQVLTAEGRSWTYDGTAWLVTTDSEPVALVGLPVGGSTGQVLVKASAADYDTAWATPAAGGGSGVTSYNDLTDKPTLFSGSYTDLTNKPVLFDGAYDSLTNKPTIPTVPTSVSAFTNDSGYLVAADIAGKANSASPSFTGTGTLSNGFRFTGDFNTAANRPGFKGNTGTTTSVMVYAPDTTGTTAAINLTSTGSTFGTGSPFMSLQSTSNSEGRITWGISGSSPTQPFKFNSSSGTTLYQLNQTGTPTNGTDLVHKTYADSLKFWTKTTFSGTENNNSSIEPAAGVANTSATMTIKDGAYTEDHHELVLNLAKNQYGHFGYLKMVAKDASGNEVTPTGSLSIKNGSGAEVFLGPTNVNLTADTVTFSKLLTKPDGTVNLGTPTSNANSQYFAIKPAVNGTGVGGSDATMSVNSGPYGTTRHNLTFAAGFANDGAEFARIHLGELHSTGPGTQDASASTIDLEIVNEGTTNSQILLKANGAIELNGTSVKVPTPTLASHAATKQYVDDSIAAIPAGSGGGVTSYNDLTDKPTLFSGSYTDLTDKPTIPTVPTNVSAFTNDAGYLVAADVDGKANTSSLATVATTGAYADLTGKPTIPTDNASLTNGAGYATTTYVDSVSTGVPDQARHAIYVTRNLTYDNTTGVITGPDLSGYALSSSVPTANSQLTNDAGYQTAAQVSTLIAADTSTIDGGIF